MGFVEYFWEYSKLLTEFKAKLVADSYAEGLAEGRAEAGRRVLKVVLASKFPGLEALPQLAKIKSSKTLQNLLVTACGNDPATVKRAILRAARRSAT